MIISKNGIKAEKLVRAGALRGEGTEWDQTGSKFSRAGE